MSQKYVIVHFIDIANVPEEFPSSEWPLHVTLLANFTIAQPLEQLKNDLADYALQAKPFDITVEGEALFGPSKNVAVSLIRPNNNITKVHNNLSSITIKLRAIYDEPAFMGDGYRPHATIQHNSHLADKQTVTLNDLTLVDMYPKNDINRRKIIKTFQLGG